MYNGEISVASTYIERWIGHTNKSDVEFVANARTLVLITLKGTGNAIEETVQLFCPPSDPWRELSVNRMADLFEIAWIIKNQHLNRKIVFKKFFGLELK